MVSHRSWPAWAKRVRGPRDNQVYPSREAGEVLSKTLNQRSYEVKGLYINPPSVCVGVFRFPVSIFHIYRISTL